MLLLFSFLFNAPPTTVIYTLSLHDALPILRALWKQTAGGAKAYGWQDIRAALTATSPGDWEEFYHRYIQGHEPLPMEEALKLDRKSTRLNSSHLGISYAVFCLKKKKKKEQKLNAQQLTHSQKIPSHKTYTPRIAHRHRSAYSLVSECTLQHEAPCRRPPWRPS